MSNSSRDRGQSRETELLTLAAQGLTDKEIAKTLGISIDTVDTYWRRIRNRYSVSSRTEAVARAVSEELTRALERERLEKERLLREMAERHRVERELRNLMQRLEERVANRTEQLQDALDRLRAVQAVVEGTGAVVWWSRGEPPWPVLYISENVSQWGYRPDEITAGNVLLKDIMHPEDVPEFFNDLDASLKCPYRLLDREYRLRTRTGDYRLIRERLVYLPNQSDGSSRVQGIQMDITGTKDLSKRKPAAFVRDLQYPITPITELFDGCGPDRPHLAKS